MILFTMGLIAKYNELEDAPSPILEQPTKKERYIRNTQLLERLQSVYQKRIQQINTYYLMKDSKNKDGK